jgi:hypothetical protein
LAQCRRERDQLRSEANSPDVGANVIVGHGRLDSVSWVGAVDLFCFVSVGLPDTQYNSAYTLTVAWTGDRLEVRRRIVSGGYGGTLTNHLILSVGLATLRVPPALGYPAALMEEPS